MTSTTNNSALKGFTSGSLAACCAVTFTNPSEVIKTQLQLVGELGVNAGNKSAISILTHLYKSEGIYGVQRGLISAYYYQMSMNGVRFMVYDPLKKLFYNEKSEFLTSILAGGISGALGAFAGTPFNLVKTRIQSLQYQYKSTFNGLAEIVRVDGIKGLYRGVDAAMLRTGIGSSLQLSSYDFIKLRLLQYPEYFGNNIGTHFFTSLLTGFITCIGMNPPDVVNTRLYNQKHNQYKGIFDCFLKTVKYEGFFALYKGFWPLFIRTGPHTILTFVFLEQIRFLINKASN